jgi:Fe-S-cluster containining protein
MAHLLQPLDVGRLPRHLELQEVTAGKRADRCTFLDDGGACRIYPVRPLLCRTHGLALKAATSRPGLTIVDNVSHCALNYTARPPTAAEVLDADRLLALLVTVDRRFRAAAALDDNGSRVPLASLLA